MYQRYIKKKEKWFLILISVYPHIPTKISLNCDSGLYKQANWASWASNLMRFQPTDTWRWMSNCNGLPRSVDWAEIIFSLHSCAIEVQLLEDFLSGRHIKWQEGDGVVKWRRLNWCDSCHNLIGRSQRKSFGFLAQDIKLIKESKENCQW